MPKQRLLGPALLAAPLFSNVDHAHPDVRCAQYHPSAAVYTKRQVSGSALLASLLVLVMPVRVRVAQIPAPPLPTTPKDGHVNWSSLS